MQVKGAAGATKTSTGAAIKTAFEQMQKQFQRELSMTSSSQRAHSRKGALLTNITRAKNIPRSIEKLQLTSVVQMGAVGQLSKYGKVCWVMV